MSQTGIKFSFTVSTYDPSVRTGETVRTGRPLEVDIWVGKWIPENPLVVSLGELSSILKFLIFCTADSIADNPFLTISSREL